MRLFRTLAIAAFLILVSAAGFLSTGYGRAQFSASGFSLGRERFSYSGGMTDQVSWSKFWRYGDGNDVNGIAFVVYCDYGTIKERDLCGASSSGGGYHDRDGRVVTFAIVEPNMLMILDKCMDVRNGRFFHVSQADANHLSVTQETGISPMVEKIIAQ